MFVYVLICNLFDFEIMSKMRMLLEVLKIYKNCFDFKNAKTLLEYKNEDHVINFFFDVESLYELLYILIKIEFNILKDYLVKNLILNCIREFTNRASASMLFVF